MFEKQSAQVYLVTNTSKKRKKKKAKPVPHPYEATPEYIPDNYTVQIFICHPLSAHTWGHLSTNLYLAHRGQMRLQQFCNTTAFNGIQPEGLYDDTVLVHSGGGGSGSGSGSRAEQMLALPAQCLGGTSSPSHTASGLKGSSERLFLFFLQQLVNWTDLLWFTISHHAVHEP